VKNSGMRILLIHIFIEQTRLWDAVASYVHGIHLLIIRGCLFNLSRFLRFLIFFFFKTVMFFKD